jgi:hypothetical protein
MQLWFYSMLQLVSNQLNVSTVLHISLGCVFFYKNVNVMTCMCMWGLRLQSARHTSCSELKKLVAGAKTQEFSLSVTNHTIE